MRRSSRLSHKVQFEISSSSEAEDDYLLYQRLDGNGRPIENDIIRIPRSQSSFLRFAEILRDQVPLLVNPVNHYHFNINVTIPNVNTTNISRSKISQSKITQEQKITSKVSKKVASSQVVDESNPTGNSDDEAPSNQGNRYKFAIIRKPRKPLRRRQSSSTDEEFQEGNNDSDASLKSTASNSPQSGSEGNQGANNSKSLGNQVNYITPITRKVYSRCSNDQNQTVNPLISVRKSDMKKCQQIQKASALQQCGNGCGPFDDYADKSGRATLGNQVNHVTSGKRNACIRRINEQNINAMPKLEQNKHSKSQSQQIQKVSASQQCGNGCESSNDYAHKSESANLGNQVNHVTPGNQNVNPRITMNFNPLPKPEQNRHFMSKSQQIQYCNNTASGVISNKF